MSEAQIRFSTDILQRLGEELNPSPDQGIIELIKNAYDANASECLVRLTSVTAPGGQVEIIDDGDGMNANAIKNNWLVLGRSSKAKNEKTRLGRIPAGSKGLGRLAALRMGEQISLRTLPYSHPKNIYGLDIDWSDYNKVKVVEEVSLDIKSYKRKAHDHNGTEVTIKKLKNKISHWDVKRLAKAMILLSDPFDEDSSGFRPILDAPEYKDMENLVKNRYMDFADYHLTVKLNSDGYVSTAQVKDWRGRILFEADHAEIAISRKGKPYTAPESEINLWIFVMNTASFDSKSVSLAEVRHWLSEFGGVHLYENNIRVQPYGNSGNDWLDMNLSRAKSPEERPSTNTSIGKVSITDSEGILEQKTDRSGYIESDKFIELRKFSQDSLEWLARCRMHVAEQRRSKNKKEHEHKSKEASKEIESIINSAPKNIRKELNMAFDKKEKATERKVRDLKREIQLYRTLSTAGITAATFAHESHGSPIKILTSVAGSLERRLKKELPNTYEKSFSKPIMSIRNALKSLSFLTSATLGLLDQSKRRVGKVEIHQIINTVVSEFKPFIIGRGAVVKLNLVKGDPYFRGAEAALESVVTNLINNSLAAFEGSFNKTREILITTNLEDGSLVLTVADSGPGLEGISGRYVWLPGQTTKENGTGLGLTIVHDSIRDLDGSVKAIEHGQLGGAEFIIKIPILGF